MIYSDAMNTCVICGGIAPMGRAACAECEELCRRPNQFVAELLFVDASRTLLPATSLPPVSWAPVAPVARRADLAALGTRIRAARDAADMTQAQLAGIVSTAPNTIARIERGEQEPSALLLGRLAQALEVSADHLLGIDA